MIGNDYALNAYNQSLADPSYRDAEYYRVANRISYHFNLTGPSVVLDTACSASGTAIHLARKALQNAECKMAMIFVDSDSSSESDTQADDANFGFLKFKPAN